MRTFRVTCCMRCRTLIRHLLSAQGRRDGSTSDEAFAWQSREFLRQKAIGQVGALRTHMILLLSMPQVVAIILA